MGRNKKSIVWDFFEQKYDGKAYINSCQLCSYGIAISGLQAAKGLRILKKSIAQGDSNPET